VTGTRARSVELLKAGEADARALVISGSGHVVTYAGLREAAEGVARRLHSIRIGKGSHMLFALASLGATVGPLNPACKCGECACHVDDFEPDLLFLTASNWPPGRWRVPDALHILDAIPRTPTVKVQRKHIGQALAEARS
jgi:non-ribosomal peptide synthetase component E (peptide arylation enzyme)